MKNRSLHIKNMVCPRCITAVEQTLNKLNIPFEEVKLGQAILNIDKNKIDFEILDKELRNIGFELIQDKNIKLVEEIKNIIIDYTHHSDNNSFTINFSNYLSTKIDKDYSYISNIFSETEKTTIEKYLILQKIERVKELISYSELNFSEIAFKLNYSSVAHLSKQFKQITGLTLTQFKNSENKERNHLSDI